MCSMANMVYVRIYVLIEWIVGEYLFEELRPGTLISVRASTLVLDYCCDGEV